jgi:16S rRNA C967 or C1407 C5-methylase (RsmB/RsmF family)
MKRKPAPRHFRPRPSARKTELDESEPGATRPARREAVLKSFQKVWSDLFMTPVHLDSALSKQPKNVKGILAQILPTILLKPVSQAQALGIGLPPEEPWALGGPKLANWRPAGLMAERLHEALTARPSMPQAIPEDFPPRFRKEWEQDWGSAGAEELARALSSPPPLSLRASRSTGAERLKVSLEEGGKLPVRAETSRVSVLGLRLAGYVPILGTKSFERGEFEIQDEGSQVMALFALWPETFAGVLQPAPGPAGAQDTMPVLPSVPTKSWTVIDACAGAGGKTLAMADALGGKGRVFAYDTSLKKLQALKRRASRAGLRNIHTLAVEEGKEATALKKFHGTADSVLVDAPCSGWGVLRRNPDIKWRQPADTLTRMPALQQRILKQYSVLVAPGGWLVYGVCTFRKAETTEVTRLFLEENQDFDAGPGGYLGPDPCDGFYMQAFRRKGGLK